MRAKKPKRSQKNPDSNPMPEHSNFSMTNLKERIRILPIIGWIAVWLAALFTLGSTKRHLLDFIEYIKGQMKGQNEIHSQQLQHQQLLQNEQHNHLHSQISSLTYELRQLETQLEHLISIKSESGIELSPSQGNQEKSEELSSNNKFDKFYLAFEERFRGSEDSIKSRLSHYLSYINTVNNNISITEDSPVLDIGCGRGEWLELLKENHFPAQGLDMNPEMIKKCINKQLSAIQVDALTFLKQQEEGSFSVISGFHIIEHLPFYILLDLFDECLRVLKPGGLIIFETPNPENILVGSHTFYYDSTHKNPLPPALIEFLAQHRGFDQVEILRSSPYPEDQQIPGSDGIAGQHINQFFYGAQDYAVIGFKRSPKSQI